MLINPQQAQLILPPSNHIWIILLPQCLSLLRHQILLCLPFQLLRSRYPRNFLFSPLLNNLLLSYKLTEPGNSIAVCCIEKLNAIYMHDIWLEDCVGNVGDLHPLHDREG